MSSSRLHAYTDQHLASSSVQLNWLYADFATEWKPNIINRIWTRSNAVCVQPLQR